jgi:hypothetical protein
MLQPFISSLGCIPVTFDIFLRLDYDPLSVQDLTMYKIVDPPEQA